jgi:hypothetical protein
MDRCAKSQCLKNLVLKGIKLIRKGFKKVIIFSFIKCSEGEKGVILSLRGTARAIFFINCPDSSLSGKNDDYNI